VCCKLVEVDPVLKRELFRSAMKIVVEFYGRGIFVSMDFGNYVS
jgi:hypothetical protein